MVDSVLYMYIMIKKILVLTQKNLRIPGAMAHHFTQLSCTEPGVVCASRGKNYSACENSRIFLSV